jgi:hypothetical protein
MLAIIVVEIMMIFEGDRLLIVKVLNVHIPFLFLNFFVGHHFSFHVALHPRYATYTYDTFIHTYYAVYNAYLMVFCLPILTHTEACAVLCIGMYTILPPREPSLLARKLLARMLLTQIKIVHDLNQLEQSKYTQLNNFQH